MTTKDECSVFVSHACKLITLPVNITLCHHFWALRQCTIGNNVMSCVFCQLLSCASCVSLFELVNEIVSYLNNCKSYNEIRTRQLR